MERTQGIWRATAFGVYSGEIEVADCALGNKRQPTLTYTEVEANAERIVKAVNCHDGLVEALKDVGKEIRITTPHGYGIFIHIADWKKQYEPIIAKAD